MDKHWPWKKKISTNGDQGKAKIQYVQISAESYSHLTELESQVKDFSEKLSLAQSEMTTKDNLVKQHAKVAEEAIAGWEKAEAETLALKTQLESVTLLKLTAENRASHLDDALKECMKQMRNVKEEGEQKLHDTIFSKTKQWEAINSELDVRIADFEQELLRSSAENAALSRSLQERSNLLMMISNEKSQAEAEIEVLKSGIQSCEKEINSLKYEVHVVSKELEIRNEEKNMSARLAESSNKQHIEDVKKISKLEAECQRLRSLVKKKLPGPAALAQMKLEVENLGGDTRIRRSPAKNSSPYLSMTQNFSLQDMHQCQKENEYLAAQLLATEEEMKMLKEALSNRNNELVASRSIYAKSPSKVCRNFGASVSHHQRNLSLTSMSEDGIGEEGSCAESCSTAAISELSPLKRENSTEQNKTESRQQMELMDDFLEMEKLALLSTETNTKNEAMLEKPTNILPENEEHSVVMSDSRTSLNGNLCNKIDCVIDESLRNAISLIHDTVVLLCKEAVDTQARTTDDCVLGQKVKEFSASVNKLSCDETNLHDFIFALSNILSTTRDIRLSILTQKGSECESSSNDWIDKLTLQEKRVAQYESKKPRQLGDNALQSLPGCDDSNLQGCELQFTSQNGYIEEHERVKEELVRCTESYGHAKIQLVEMEQHSAELKLQLAACQKLNSLSDTQLKCMAESYRLLESRKIELETDMNLLHAKFKDLENELLEEKRSHQDDLVKYNDLQEQIERDKRCSMCCLQSDVDAENKTKQDREIAAAAEKLAECQETMILLDRQLKALQPPAELNGSSPMHKSQSNALYQDGHNLDYYSQQSTNASTENDDAASVIERTSERDSSLDAYNSHFVRSRAESIILAKPQKSRSRSASASSLSSMLNEKQSRGLSRFFYKGKSSH